MNALKLIISRHTAHQISNPLLEKLGCEIKSIDTVVLTEEEKKQYGDWNRDALESGHIGRIVAKKHRVKER